MQNTAMGCARMNLKESNMDDSELIHCTLEHDLHQCTTELRHQTLKLLASQSENRVLRENIMRLRQENTALRKCIGTDHVVEMEH